MALAYLSERGGSKLKDYINDWVKGHFLPLADLQKGQIEYHHVRSRRWMAARQRRLQ